MFTIWLRLLPLPVPISWTHDVHVRRSALRVRITYRDYKRVENDSMVGRSLLEIHTGSDKPFGIGVVNQD